MGNYFATVPKYIGNSFLTTTHLADSVDMNVFPTKDPRMELKFDEHWNDGNILTVDDRFSDTPLKEDSIIAKLWCKFQSLFYMPYVCNLVERIQRYNTLFKSTKSSESLEEVIVESQTWEREPKRQISFKEPSFQNVVFECKQKKKSAVIFSTNLLLHNVKMVQPTFFHSLTNDFIITDSKEIIHNERECFNLKLTKDHLQLNNDCLNPNRVFQRLDSGIEDISNGDKNSHDTCTFDLMDTTRDSSSFVEESLHCDIRRKFSQNSRENASIDMSKSCFRLKPVSFFIDIREPFEQKPLADDYKFLSYDSKRSDSVFSEQFSLDSCSDDSDDDFIVFEEHVCANNCSNGFIVEITTPYKTSCYCTCYNDGSSKCDLSSSFMDENQNGKKQKNAEQCHVMTENNSVFTRTRSKKGTFPTHVSELLKDHAHSKYNIESPMDLNYHLSSQDCLQNVFTNVNLESASSCVDFKHTWQNSLCYTQSNRDEKFNFKKLDSNDKIIRTSFSESKNLCHATSPRKQSKRVSFQKDDNLAVVHVMRCWNFAYRKARKGNWEQFAVDRLRFKRRIQELERTLSPFLKRKILSIQANNN